jgi:hypothetical protein
MHLRLEQFVELSAGGKDLTGSCTWRGSKPGTPSTFSSVAETDRSTPLAFFRPGIGMLTIISLLPLSELRWMVCEPQQGSELPSTVTEIGQGN